MPVCGLRKFRIRSSNPEPKAGFASPLNFSANKGNNVNQLVMNKVLFSRKSDIWATPRDFFSKLDSQYHFTLDPCCNAPFPSMLVFINHLS